MAEVQISFNELLRVDRFFRGWTSKQPKLRDTLRTPTAMPWRVYVQREEKGNWARKDLHTYTEAYTWLWPRLSGFHDAAIHSKGQHFRPPVVKIGKAKHYIPVPAGHKWCTLCRRPTVFSNFRRHHVLPGMKYEETIRRCTICGIRETSIKEYKSRLQWPIPPI